PGSVRPVHHRAFTFDGHNPSDTKSGRTPSARTDELREQPLPARHVRGRSGARADASARTRPTKRQGDNVMDMILGSCRAGIGAGNRPIFEMTGKRASPAPVLSPAGCRTGAR